MSAEEKNRIVEVYNARWESDLARYSLINHGQLLMQYDYERHLYKIISTSFSSVENLKVLEIGCGTGIRLTDFIRINIPKDQLYGVDLHADSLTWAKVNRLDAHYYHANASELPFEDNYFDIILLRTVFSSIFDDQLCKKIAAEALRTCKADGIIVSYDLRIRNPGNKNVRPITKKWLVDKFETDTLYSKTLTLPPPLSRLLGKFGNGMVLYSFLMLFPFFRSCLMLVFRKKS